MSCTFPKGTLAVTGVANCDLGQAKGIEDRAFKTNTTRMWTPQFYALSHYHAETP